MELRLLSDLVGAMGSGGSTGGTGCTAGVLLWGSGWADSALLWAHAEARPPGSADGLGLLPRTLVGAGGPGLVTSLTAVWLRMLCVDVGVVMVMVVWALAVRWSVLVGVTW
jgi:hypothetical protein